MTIEIHAVSVCVILASHNRKQKTLECIASILLQKKDVPTEVNIILIDDCSSDGTVQAVRELSPAVRVIGGTGSLYWNGAMHVAFGVAIEDDFDYYLLLNDDTVLYSHGLATLIESHIQLTQSGRELVVVIGSTRDPVSGLLTYGGRRRIGRWNPLKMEKILPADECLQSDTMNGNCVLIPRNVVKKVGNLDVQFTHSLGDMDYGFRTKRLGGELWVAPQFVASCALNTERGMWENKNFPLTVRWSKLLGPKGLPLREWLIFSYRHGGWFWPLIWLNPYLKFWIRGILRR